jgi:hypothetical protein
MDDENVPMDVTATQAEAVVKAAMAWAYSIDISDRFTQLEWRLYEALTAYGDEYKGLVSR